MWMLFIVTATTNFRPPSYHYLSSFPVAVVTNYTLPRWLKTIQIYSLQVLGQKSKISIPGLKSRCVSSAALPPEALGRICSLLFPPSGGCWHSLICGHVTLIFISVVTLPPLCVCQISAFLLYIRVFAFRARLDKPR